MRDTRDTGEKGDAEQTRAALSIQAASCIQHPAILSPSTLEIQPLSRFHCYHHFSFTISPIMRRSILLFGIACTLIFTYLLYSFSTLISLLLEDYTIDAIHRSELPAQNSSLIDTRPQLIPKIIHQTYKNETIPSMWRDAQKSCVSLHDDYEYIVRSAFRLPCFDQNFGCSDC